MIDKPRLSEYDLTYPKFYAVSDMGWMFQQLDRLDMGHRQKISFEYEKLYLTDGRARANGLLKKYVDKYGSSPTVARSDDYGDAPNPFKDRLDKIRQGGATGRKSILNMMDSKG